ncbi:hypothetical protein AUC43_18470 [Hymenobacter sedentarius]|uniref:Uncharacterized protein n=2 Tax=Hymenobacter sedentarius TaxID=1411621 RepID=A0A0U4BTX4_9BACT|nr:hypothetical protein AUC43_18470 [Hymenobacter sedentarius]
MLADIGLGLTRAQALAAPKIFQLNHRIGQREVVKLLVLILRAFVDSLRVKEKPDAADLITLADDLARTYTHDSVKDIILALKEARTGGHNFYQALDVSTLYKLIADYFEQKACFLENRHLDQKANGASTQAADVKLLGDAAPRMLEHVAQQIPADHPNAEGLRQKLTITNQKARRGLITPEQAAQQRAEARAATQRKARPDWKASPEAQQQIDKRHRQENRKIMERYRSPNL